MNITGYANANIYAMRKGQTEQALGSTPIDTTITSADYSGNFLSKALYKVPVNPLLLRGNISEDFADFTVSGGFYDTGVLVNGAISADTTKTIVVDTGGVSGFDATDRFKVGDFVYDDTNALVGTIASLTATIITLEENNIVALANNEDLKVRFQTINSYEIHKADNDILTHATAGINQAYQVKASFTLNSNTTANSGDTTGVFAGMSVTGTNIPDGTTVSSVTNTTTFVLSASATGSGATELTFTKQTYNAVNRIYPNNNTGITSVNEYLSNLETTRGNAIKTYDVDTDKGQKFVTAGVELDGAVTPTATTITLSGGSNLEGQVIIIGNEHMYVSSFNNATLVANVVRGYEGTEVPDDNYADETPVFVKDNIDHLWVLVYADDPNTHHFAKITKLLEYDVLGDGFEFEPAIKGDITKDTKYAIFSSLDSNLPKIDSDNQTLVACAYGLQGTQDNTRHHANTHVSRPFFYFLNGKKRLEPSTRYVLRATYSTGISTSYTYSVFVTAPEYGADIIDYGPYTMEATVVDMMYKADDPVAVDTLQYTSDNLALTNGSPDTVTVGTDASFDNSITDLDGSTTNWGLQGILKDSRFALDTDADVEIESFHIVEGNSSTATTLTMAASDFSGASESNDLGLYFTGHAVDLDHNKMYCVFSSSHYGTTSGGFFKMKDAFRMAHRPKDDDGYYYGHAIGQTRYMHYSESPLTNSVIPNALDMSIFESVTSSGGYVDMVFADAQKILVKKIKEGDNITVNKVLSVEEVGSSRNNQIGGVFDYNGGLTIDVINLENNQDLRFILESSIPKTNTDTTSRFDPLFDAFTVNVDNVLYHIVPDKISNVSSNSQEFAVRLWRKETDTEYNTTTLTSGSVPNFNTEGFRRKYSFLADNIMSNIEIDTLVSNYDLDYDGASAQPTNRNITNFENLFETAGASLDIGDTSIEESYLSRIHDSNIILLGGNFTGHRFKVDYGDKNNKILKLQPHLKDERFLELYNKTDYLPYADRLSNVSLYGYPINSGDDPEGTGSRFRYDLGRSPSSSGSTHVRGVTSYLDYFTGDMEIERTVFSGVIESIEQVVEDGMFKLKIRGRDSSAELLGPIVNKNFKFTEDIIYSTVGPIERMALYGAINYNGAEGGSGAGAGIYEVGTTQIVLAKDSNALIDAAVGDLLFTSLGTYIGRIHSIPSSNTYNLEEGIPTRLKDDEPIMISSQFAGLLEDVQPSFLSDTNTTTSQITKQNIRGNTISFAKAITANPYSTIRVNSLSGSGDKGIIFSGGNSLNLSNAKAPSLEGGNLIGSSSSSHPLAKGYNIHAPNSIDYDLPFYCHLADEVTDSYNIDYVNLHTVNSLTDYDVINISSKDEETVIEVAPVCPAVLARVDDNPLDNRDKSLVHIGHFPNATTLLGSDSIPSGHNGIFSYEEASASTDSTWLTSLKEGDFIFDSTGNLFGRVIDISASSTDGITGNAICFTLDRPLFKAVNSGEGIYKYYSSASPPTYHSGIDIEFVGGENTIANFGGSSFRVHKIKSGTPAGRAFLEKLEAGMRIKIEGHADKDNNGIFSIAHVFTDAADKDIVFYVRKAKEGVIGTGGGIDDDSAGDSIRITVLTDYFTQGLYFLNTQGLGQGGVISLLNNYLSSPNAVDNICKPIKWNGPISRYFTDTGTGGKSVEQQIHTSDHSADFSDDTNAYTPYSDYIYRYGNTKWRYFGLQKGLALSYINRRKKDGQIKNAYTSEKGKVSGYATAYRIADAKYGTDKVIKFPYGYHNNDFAYNVKRFLPLVSNYEELFDSNNYIKEYPSNLEYLSPESRDFRPVTGSNFADFTKHGMSSVTSNNSNYSPLLYPRFVPRIHDNHQGGDWQEDTEGPVNSIDTSLIYQKFTAESRNFTDSTCDTNHTSGLSDGSSTSVRHITHNANSDIVAGLSVIGAGIPVGATIASINTSTCFTLSADTTATNSNTTLTFSDDAQDYDIEWLGGDGHAAYIDPAAGDSANFTTTLANRWVKLGGWPDKNNNRTFRLGSLASSKYTMEVTKIPFTQIGVDTLDTKTGVGGSADTTTGFEQITVLYEPYIGPKFDAITRAKDHWELPDPKTMRWFIFSSSDLYPDSMARKNHIGYSGTVDSTTISRRFTDYNILLKGKSATKSSTVLHEYYEGTLPELQETDDLYENLPINEASILPSEIKRFGLMRLIDCTYDWHFNLIDPERLPSDMSKLNTPNFEYTRYQPLQRVNLLITNYDDDTNVLTVTEGDGTTVDTLTFSDSTCDLTNGDATVTCDSSANIFVGMAVSCATSGFPANAYVHSINTGTEGTNVTSFELSANFTGTTASNQTLTFDRPVQIGEQLFTDKGYYLGKVKSLHPTFTQGSCSYNNDPTITHGANANIVAGLSVSGTGIPAGAYIASITDSTHFELSVSTTDGSLSSQTLTFGNAITLVGAKSTSPILKSDGSRNKYYGYVHICGDGTTSLAAQDRHDSFFRFRTKGRAGKNTFTEVSDGELNMLQGMVNAMYYSSNYKQLPYGGIDDAVFADGEGSSFVDVDDGGGVVVNNINESKFMSHFNENFTALSTSYSSHFVLPPSFRAYFSAHTTSSNSAESGRTVNAMQSRGYLVNRADNNIQNPIGTEYSHASNVLEWIQEGGNPYSNCDVVALGRYNIEQSITNIPVGGKLKIGEGYENNTLQGFPYSKPAVFVVPSCDYNNSTAINTHGTPIGGTIKIGQGVMGNGIPEGAYVASIVDANNFVLSVDTTGGSLTTDLFLTNDLISDIPYGNSKGGITDSDLTNANSGEYTFLTAGVHAYYPYALYKSDTPTTAHFSDEDGKNYVADGVYSAFVPHLDLEWMSTANLKEHNISPHISDEQYGYSTFNSINGSDSKEGWIRIVTRLDLSSSHTSEPSNYSAVSDNSFLNFVDLTGMYLVGNIGTAIGTTPTQKDFKPFNTVGDSHVTVDTIPNAKGIMDGLAVTSMADTMVDPRHIIYVKDHRREITGNRVAHELLLDNIPFNNAGTQDFFSKYRVMRPAETCVWPSSPNELNLYCLSAQTTKEPQSASMYGFIPPLSRINSQGEFTGKENLSSNNNNLVSNGEQGENEGIMSMYMAIDMDGRHSQQQTLTGTISNIDVGNTVLTGSGTKFTDELKEGDVILLDHDKCYVKSIISDTSLVIAGKFGNDSDLSSGSIKLFNNTFTVLRDYIHLFNPTGNRNTFKSGESYSMLLNDGVSKQKMSIGVEADYYDDRALCKLTLSDKVSQPMYGIVSFGEIFSLKSSVISKISSAETLKIGSTIVMGQEVEDVINNLLSEEDIKYDIRDNKEYPYFISPNYQGVDIFSAANFAAKYKEKQLRIDEEGISLIKDINDLDYQQVDLSHDNTNLNIIGVTRNKSTFDLYNEIIVYGSGVKSIKRNRKSIDKLGKKTLEEVNMELISQDDVDARAKSLLSAHSGGEDRFTIQMSMRGIEYVKAGDLVTLDFPAEGITKGEYKIYEIRRNTSGLVELEVGTYRKDLANRFAELSIQNKSNSASIRGSQFSATTAPLDFFDTIKLKELRLVIKKISLADEDAFTLGFQTLATRKLDFGDTMGPLESITTIITDEDLI